MYLPVHLRHLGTHPAHFSWTKNEKRKNHKGILQDNSAEEETASQWSPDIIHNIDRRPLYTEGRAHLKVTGLGDGGVVCMALPPRQQPP